MSKILLVTGPSSAGKTTSVGSFLNKVEGVWAYVGQDDTHGLIKAGYKSANGLRDTWDPETQKQWQASIAVSCDLIKSFYNQDINCIVDFFAPPEEFNIWKELLLGMQYQLVVIMPDLQTALKRNNQKTGTAYLSEDKIRSCFQEFIAQSYSDSVYTVDTSGNDLDKVVDQLLAFS